MLLASTTSFNAATIIEIIVGIFGTLGILTGAIVVVRGGLMSAQNEGLRKDLSDRGVRIDILLDDKAQAELTIAKLKEEKAIEAAKYVEEIRILAERNKVLETVVTGADELASITSLIEAHDRKADRLGGDIIKAIKGEVAS